MNYFKKYIQTVTLFLFSVLLASCHKDFLEVTPKGKLIASTVNDYNLLLSNTDLSTTTVYSQIPMGDEVVAVEPYFSGTDLSTQRLFRWDAVIYEPNQEANEMVYPMKQIYTYNAIINEVPNASAGTDQQKKSLQAEALAGRAWTNFLLINYYGKPYTASSAATDPGFPIVTESDVTKTNFSRATVKEVYDFILSDLNTAIPNLPVKASYRIRMSKPAAEALLAKVYIFMGKFSEALPQLNAAIADLASATMPVGLYDYKVTFGPGGAFLPIGIFGPNYPGIFDDQEALYLKQYLNNWAFNANELVVSPQASALFTSSDLRRNFYLPQTYPAGTLLKRGPIRTQIGITLPDIYLLRAECKARLNDLAGAKADVEALRVKRMPAADVPVPAAIAIQQQALTKFILEERIREFALQGYRWFDMRRLSVDPVYSSTVNTTHTLYSASGGTTTTFTLKPERLVLRFPQRVMDQNPGMENNQ